MRTSFWYSLTILDDDDDDDEVEDNDNDDDNNDKDVSAVGLDRDMGFHEDLSLVFLYDPR